MASSGEKPPLASTRSSIWSLPYTSRMRLISLAPYGSRWHYLQLYAVETSLQFLFQSSQHFLVSAHPYQAIDGDALLASAEWRVVEVNQVLCPSRNCETLLSIFRKSCRRCSRIPLCRSKETGKSRSMPKVILGKHESYHTECAPSVLPSGKPVGASPRIQAWHRNSGRAMWHTLPLPLYQEPLGW